MLPRFAVFVGSLSVFVQCIAGPPPRVPALCATPSAASVWVQGTQRRVLAGEAPLRALVLLPERKVGLGNRMKTLRGALALAIWTSRALLVAPQAMATAEGPPDDELKLLHPAGFDWRLDGNKEAAADVLRSVRERWENATVLPKAVAMAALGRDAARQWGADEEILVLRNEFKDMGQLLGLAWTEAWPSCAYRLLFAPSPGLRKRLCKRGPIATAKVTCHLRTNAEFSKKFRIFEKLKRKAAPAPLARCGPEAEVEAHLAACLRGAAEALVAAGGAPPAVHLASDHEPGVAWLRRHLVDQGGVAGNATVETSPEAWKVHSGHLNRAHGRLAYGNVAGPLLEALDAARSLRFLVGTAGSSYTELIGDLAGANVSWNVSSGICDEPGDARRDWWTDLAPGAPSGGCRDPLVPRVYFRGDFRLADVGPGLPLPPTWRETTALCARLVAADEAACGDARRRHLGEWNAWLRCDAA